MNILIEHKAPPPLGIMAIEGSRGIPGSFDYAIRRVRYDKNQRQYAHGNYYDLFAVLWAWQRGNAVPWATSEMRWLNALVDEKGWAPW